MQVNLDIAALRTLVIGMELGSFAKAADRVGRSTSAVSAQIKKLEEQAGAPLFRKAGRGLALTDAGEIMLDYARRMVGLNDEAAAATRGLDMEGWIRLGLQEDFGEALLPQLLGRFARAHPKVRIEARVARNTALQERFDAGQLDLALLWNGNPDVRHTGERLASPRMCWIGASALPWQPQSGEPLPLIAFDRPCLFTQAATAALDRARIPWRLVFTSPSLNGLWAATAAGLGINVRTPYGLPGTVRVLDAKAAGLPPLPAIPLMLLMRSGESRPLADRLATMMREHLAGTMAPVVATRATLASRPGLEGLARMAAAPADRHAAGTPAA
ncbi:LysR substrate-binding domain-containing protein [Bordetella bronchialis]|uniref:LysR family transcriptional regulator n=1 Tax=Bordetella bronchialis TaxID=463025 RepID=A0A193FU21_9BORD|nr:LysR substrate-binding domain-containing protein [Bordetella bronchialis]ANN70681.1 LysR family transcriptional regulator [Bordetella bronchialis]